MILKQLTRLLVVLTLAHTQLHASEVEQAHFEVTNDIITPDLKPFTATIGTYGSGKRLSTANSGFEPIIFRTKYTASHGALNRIYINRTALSYYDTFKTGALDGAKVDIYRIINGKFHHIRTDTVTENGFQVSGWFPLVSKKKVISPKSTEFTFSWAPWNRSNVPYYFSVRAINIWGKLSDFSSAISVIKPQETQTSDQENNIVTFKPLLKTSIFNKPSTPENLTGELTQPGTLKLSWEHSDPTVTGYIVYKSDTPPKDHKGFYLDLADKGAAIKPGDMIFLHKKFYSESRKNILSNRIWGAGEAANLIRHSLISIFPNEDPDRNWELLPHRPDTPVTNPGETFLRITLRNNKKLALASYNHSGSGQNWYQVLKANKKYRFEVWLRGDHPQTVEFGVGGFYGRENKYLIKPFKFRITKEWKKYTTTFSPPVEYTGKTPQQMYLRLIGPSTVDVDNYRIFEADTPYLKLSAADSEKLKASGMEFLRSHALTKTKNTTYDLEQLTNIGSTTSSRRARNSLPETLEMIRSVGMQPWLQIEPHFSQKEWLGLVEYLSAEYDPEIDTPNSKPWAWKRYNQGQKTPWSSEFKKIYFEVGNETWNRIFWPWTFPSLKDAETGQAYGTGTVYGLYNEYVLDIMKSSPYWHNLQPRFKNIIGGWAHVSHFGHDAANASPSSDFLTIAGYNGGWDEDEGIVKSTPASFFNVLNQATQIATPVSKNLMDKAEKIQKERSKPLAIGTYEAGPGYVLNNLNGATVSEKQAAEQETVMKSLAAGAATLDGFLSRAQQGFTLQNYFAFDTGRYWTSHARLERGGHAYPAWDLLALFNKIGTGDLLHVKTIQVPQASLKAYRKRKAVQNAPLIAAYATQTSNRLTLFIMSRRVPDYPQKGNNGTTSITIDLPISSAKKITEYSLSGTYTSHNVFSKDVRIISKNVSETVSLPTLEIPELPPGETLIFTFEGIDK